MSEEQNSMIFDAGDFHIELRAKIYKDDPVVNNVAMYVAVESNGFAGTMEMDVGSNDLEDFIRDVLIMNKDLKGKARIEEPYGNRCYLELGIDKSGHVTVTGMLKTLAQKLEFENTFDQTYLADLARKLAQTDKWQEVIGDQHE